MNIKRILFILAVVIGIVSSSCAAYAQQVIKTKLYYDGSLHNYEAQEIKININGNYLEKYSMLPVSIGGRTLVPARSVFETLGGNVEWNNDTREVYVSRGNDNIIIEIDNNKGTKNGEPFMMDTPPKIINDNTMIPVRAVSEALGCDVGWDNNNRTVIIVDNVVTIVEDDDKQDNSDSLLENNKDEQMEQNSNNKITMVWDQITKAEQNESPDKRISIPNLDVISPTWFEVTNSQGDILDKGSKSYVEWAHSQGYKVWALISNFNPTIIHDTLSNPEIRKKLINKISEYVDKYNLDGINIDIESMAKGDGEYYVQFIREITPVLKEKGVVVSVDMYIPTPWTSHYNMEEVGKIVDYVIIMAYDEHYSTSKESGSVASINWVDTAMGNAVKLVDPNKLIMGMPFYTRRWAEENKNGNINVTSVSMKMEDAYNHLVENNAEIVWSEEAGQYYGEYEKDGILRKIWLEDERSIEEKLKVAQKYNVAGVSGWKRGHEKAAVWDIINKYF